MESEKYTFSKKERLCSRIKIGNVYASRHKLLVFPYSVHWYLEQEGELPSPAQVLIATTKRKFKHAVDRNKVKRLTRECYRLRKPQLYQFLRERNLSLVLSVNYIHNEILTFQQLSEKFDKLIPSLMNQIEEHLESSSNSSQE